jgi:chitin disaccharide deacetylase
VTPVSSLVTDLGHPSDTRLVIIGCNGLGQAHGANVGVYETLRVGLGSTASLMVPCPWARDAAAAYRGEDVGVELVLNAELGHYRWGPITMSPSLLDGDGGFPRTPADLWDHADLDEVRRECRSQLERAVLWGLDITHLDSHLGVMARRPEFFDVFADLACEFGLPLALPARSDEASLGFPIRDLLAADNLVTPDHVVDLGGRPSRTALEAAISDLEPGVTHVRLRPALDSPEIRALDPDWSMRVEDYLVGAHDTTMRNVVERSGAIRIGFRELRALQRRRTDDCRA